MAYETKEHEAKDKAAAPADPKKDAEAALAAAMENFTAKFKTITPDQQTALNQLRDAIEASKTANAAPAK